MLQHTFSIPAYFGYLQQKLKREQKQKLEEERRAKQDEKQRIADEKKKAEEAKMQVGLLVVSDNCYNNNALCQ